MKPFKWRFGAPVGPIPGREPRRKQRDAKPAEFVAIGVDAAAVGAEYTATLSIRTDEGYVAIGSVSEISIGPRQDTRATATNGTGRDMGTLTLPSLQAAMKAMAAMKDAWEPLIRAQSQFIFPVPQFFVRPLLPPRDENALDLFDRCPMCGFVECPWWAIVKATRGQRPDWREGAIDVELAHERLLEAGKTSEGVTNANDAVQTG